MLFSAAVPFALRKKIYYANCYCCCATSFIIIILTAADVIAIRVLCRGNVAAKGLVLRCNVYYYDGERSRKRKEAFYDNAIPRYIRDPLPSRKSFPNAGILRFHKLRAHAWRTE